LLRRACETRLQDLPTGMMWQHWNGPAPTLRKGEDPMAGIRRHQQDVGRLKARLAEIEAAPVALSVTKAKARARVEQLAAAGRIDVAALVLGSGDAPRFATTSARAELFNTSPNGGVPVAFTEIPDAVALIAHLFKPQLLAAIDAELDAATDKAKALTPEERVRAATETTAEVLLAERHLASLVWAAIDKNLPAAHAPDADPIAVLGIEPVPAPPRPPVKAQWPMTIEPVGAG